MTRLYPLDPELAHSLAQRRRALGWTQNQLALQADLTEPTISKLETLRTPISPAQWAALERVLVEAERKAGVPA